MKPYETSHIRNVALVSHSGTGKTSLVESALWITGATKRLGKVDDGTSHLDTDDDELDRKISLALKLAPVEVGDTKVNLVDTPGYADFAGDQAAALRVSDSTLMSLRADAGVEAATELVWDRLQSAAKPILVAVTQMGREGADFDKAIASVRDNLSERVFPLYLPIGAGDGFTGVVDVISGEAYTYPPDGKGNWTKESVPDALVEPLAAARSALVDAAAEGDDKLVEKYLEGEELSPEEIWMGLRAAMRAGSLLPAVPTDALTGVGVAHLLEALVHVMPAPDAVGPIIGRRGEKEAELAVDAAGKPAAMVFKMASEGHTGDIFFARIYSGTLESGLDLQNTTRGHGERIAQPCVYIGKERVDLPKAVAGDMACIVKLKDTRSGDTLCDRDLDLQLPGIDYPNPTLCEAIVPKAKGDEEKMGQGLHKMVDEDPTLHVTNDGALRQTLLAGLGDMQLELVLRRLKRRYNVEVELVKPRIPYRETVKRKAEVQGRYKKQTGGRGQFGDVHLRLEPAGRGEGFEFLNEITGGVVPGKFIPAVEKGVRETMTAGVVAGYPVVDVKTALYFGSFHAVDSSEMAFKVAASMAFKKGFEKAGPVLLEPIMEVEVMVPEEFMGDVMGDISSKRGKILGMDAEGKRKCLRAHVPQGEMYRYSTHLRSITQGRAWHSETFSHYEEVPPDQMAKIIAESGQEKETASA